MMRRGEPHDNGCAEKIREMLAGGREGAIGQLVAYHHTGGTNASIEVSGVRLRPGEGIVKTSQGRLVARFDAECWETCDTELLGLLLDELDIPRGGSNRVQYRSQPQQPTMVP